MIQADLGPELEAIVLDLIESGRYSSRTQVLRDSDELKAWREAQLKEFSDSITRSKASAAARHRPLLAVASRRRRSLIA